MKMLFVSTVLLMSNTLLAAGASQSQMLVRLEITPGFVANPQSQAVTIYNDGKVTSSIQVENGMARTKNLATLSPEIMQSLRNQISAIDKKAKLVDQQVGQSRCTDSPSREVKVNRGMFVEQTIFQNSGCHDFVAQGGDKIVKIIKGLKTLAD